MVSHFGVKFTFPWLPLEVEKFFLFDSLVGLFL